MAEAKRILLGKSVNTGLGHAANDPKHGLWVSKTGYDVTASTTTPDELAFNLNTSSVCSNVPLTVKSLAVNHS